LAAQSKGEFKFLNRLYIPASCDINYNGGKSSSEKNAAIGQIFRMKQPMVSLDLVIPGQESKNRGKESLQIALHTI